MANDRLYNQRFRFKDGSLVEKYVWESDIIKNNVSKFPKKDDGEVAEPFFEEVVEPKFTVLNKMTPGQIQKDRLKRSREHYKREIWDTLPKSYKKTYLKDKNKGG